MTKVVKNKQIAKKVVKMVASKKKNTSAKIVANKRPRFSDAKQVEILIKAGRNGTTKAMRVSRALGLPIIYLEKGALTKEMPGGTKEIIQAKAPTIKTSIKLRKGLILHARK